MKNLPQTLPLLAICGLLAVSTPRAQQIDIDYMFPIGARQGSVIEAKFHGPGLSGAYAVWFGGGTRAFALETTGAGEEDKALSQGPQGIEAQVISEEQGEGEENPMIIGVRMALAPDARPGDHALRLLTPRGLSSPIPFRVLAERVITEEGDANSLPGGAQPVEFPAVVSGRIAASGELDYYTFEAGAGQELSFQVITRLPAPKFDAELALFEATGSWFDDTQTTQLAHNGEPASNTITTDPALTYRFERGGRYLARVSGFMGGGGPDFGYLLRIAPSSMPGGPTPLSHGRFQRAISPQRIDELWARTAQARPVAPPVEDPKPVAAAAAGESQAVAAATPPAADDPGAESATPAPNEVPVLNESEPNNADDAAMEFSIPSFLEGVISEPGDVDVYKFRAKAGQRLAFEIQTPIKGPPLFNPRLGVADAAGDEFLTNIHRRIQRNFTFYNKTIEPKTIYTFELEGEYRLRVRDITSRWGGPEFKYRILVRDQVPHVGAVAVNADRININPGGTRKLKVTTVQEEGYRGEVAIAVEGLPSGVRAFPGTEVEPDKGPPVDEGEKERFIPKRRDVTIMLVADADAPSFKYPQTFRVTCRSILDGKLGPVLPVREIPITVFGRP